MFKAVKPILTFGAIDRLDTTFKSCFISFWYDFLEQLIGQPSTIMKQQLLLTFHIKKTDKVIAAWKTTSYGCLQFMVVYKKCGMEESFESFVSK